VFYAYILCINLSLQKAFIRYPIHLLNYFCRLFFPCPGAEAASTNVTLS